MNIPLRVGVVKQVLKALGEDSWEQGQSQTKWSSDNERITFELEEIPEKALACIRTLIANNKTSETDRTSRIILANYDALNEDHRSVFVTRLEQCVSALKNYFADAPNKWVFTTNEIDERMVPMFVNNIEYHPDQWEVKSKRRKLVREAYVSIECSYIYRRFTGAKKFYVYRKDIIREDPGTNVGSILRKLGLNKETRQAVSIYEKEIRRFQEISVMTGQQFSASGYSYVTSGDKWRMSTKAEPMIRDGRMGKVVMDDESNEGAAQRSNNSGVNPSASTHFWTRLRKTADEVSTDEDLDELYADEEEDKFTVLPTWPYVKVFDLSKHNFCEMHVSDMHDYQWDKSAFDKLILPEGHKKLVEILTTGTNELMEDIIAGKTGGIIILATGKPGVGKTLTAEVYSEFIEKPVYSVQCSQLGLNVDSIEKNLTTILERAQRWNALLLLDEADVYIRHRGHDLHHNAIVGVFLRILEYYRGVLFMTSNLATVIDDAVLSRVTAHIRYMKPDAIQRAELWRVLGAQYGVTFEKSMLKKLAERYEVAGRDIKSMLKLATLIDKDNVRIELLDHVFDFQDTVETMGEEKNL